MEWLRTWRVLAGACLMLAGGWASATDYTLWINGRGSGGTAGNYADWRYWGAPAAATGANPKAVNWDGRSSIASQSPRLRDALDCFCTGDNWCTVASYSAGDLLFGYTLANYGGTTRARTNAAANGAGVCAGTGGRQTGWNIRRVRVAAGSGGGSELADAGAWAVSEPLVQDLRTTTARAMYNHNATYGIWFYMYAGAKGNLASAILPGQDDGVEAYHSAGGVSGSGGRALCNPRDWFCNDLTLGTAPNQGGSTKWDFHSVAFRDDDENYEHTLNGNWEGIVSVLRVAVDADVR